MKIVGVIGFAFGQHADGSAGVSNERIARLLSQRRDREQARGNIVVLAAQWEVAMVFRTLGVPSLDCIIGRNSGLATDYLTAEQVLRAGLSYCDARGVDEVLVIGHPLHIIALRLLLLTGSWRRGVATQSRRKIALTSLSRVPYDGSSDNVQRWTRSTRSFLSYLVKIALTRHHGDQQRTPPSI